MRKVTCQVCILGAGPAGLGAALELAGAGVRDVVVVDRHAGVGGLARTLTCGGARFDVGPHRFYTKNREVHALWRRLLGADFLPVDRLTRIYYRNSFFAYPIKPLDALRRLGPVRSAHALLSFASQTLRPRGEARTFEEWITRRFGRVLYETFFKTYTEKVWGIPCREIGAEWAAQRIKGLDIIQLLRNGFGGRTASHVKTLIDQFDYPVNGSGQMYEAMAEEADRGGIRFLLGHRAGAIRHRDGRVTSIGATGPGGDDLSIEAEHYFSSIPITTFLLGCQPALDAGTLNACRSLYFREHITVNLLLDHGSPFPDQWIYVHSPDVRMARVANYRNFSAAMSGSTGGTPVSVEYFTFQSEDLWQSSDDDLAQLAVDELASLGLVRKGQVAGSWVVRETEAYPTYYLGFQPHVDRARAALTAFRNVSPIGRGGLYRYNNQDHSILSGLRAARAFVDPQAGTASAWDVNTDDDYLEEGSRR
jgi:protoporphyrinogen oxidase